ncbi:MAG TPA: hypothetical protein VFK15_10840, partial [Burkholderiales bacterium]|nr:hypothetical protein [Burkholderiales bacterium]
YIRHLQMKVRFARWADILNAAPPSADLPHARAIWHYAQGRALAARGDTAAAHRHLSELRAIAREPEVAALRLEFNTVGALLGIAEKVLAGHIAAARGDAKAAIAHLREAARREDALVYGEPPEWSVPVRQELGIVLMNAGRNGEAERTFRDDLKRFPENGWSLHGLAQALRRQDAREADEIARRWQRAWASADVKPLVFGMR